MAKAKTSSWFSSQKARVLKKWQSNSPGNSVFRNMAVLASGSGIAKVLGAISIPIITRIYTPEHMGVLSVFVAMTAMLVPFGTLRYSMALPLPKNDGLAVNLAVLCLISLGVMSTVSALVLSLFARPILALLDMQLLMPYWWLLIIAVVGAGFYEILSQWATREKAFKVVAKTNVWQSICGSLVKIGLGLLALKPLGLLLGHVVTQAGGILSLTNSFKNKFRAGGRFVTKRRILFLLKHYSNFPKYRLPSQFLLVFSVQAPLIFSAKLFGAETTGQLGLALTALALPIALFGQTTGQAYYGEIAKVGRKNPEKIRKITKYVLKRLFMLSVVPALILVIYGPWLFSISFGEEWGRAGIFARILAIYLVAQFVSSPLMSVLNVFERQGLFLRFNVVRVSLVVLIFYFSFLFSFSPTLTIIIYSIVLTAHYSAISFNIYRLIKRAGSRNLNSGISG
ncbi:MAG: lipopolysaccharide biosynthesis protein [Desulfuromonadales bacterium]|nr:lipopolysaccharide biosynthesis protein [Desulfuromonadales bacterium]MDW7758325.1 lipopolysaccharide biosynthesis protein [Desulfuromonadales bacterium]